MKYLYICFLALICFSCGNDPVLPSDYTHLSVVKITHNKNFNLLQDTIVIERTGNLTIYYSELRDINNNTFATDIVSFSILKDSILSNVDSPKK